ncbi:DNA segment, Chr 5, Wayne State University 178, expressed, isoform CRA_b [Mus musculus]|uniref:Selenoprotein I n=1 Tax=Mus musculus TaxID=10090 RepID=D6RE20_MOUSE|nr:DNA segment, Chr 5, Wayne State University 178, expressed, isoform CRA_b [Mus musculus]
MAGYEYVSPEQLSGFDKYKYSALDTNPLSLYIMHPFWNTIVKPLVISMCLTGFGLSWASSTLLPTL